MAGRARQRQGPVVQHGHRRRAVPLLPQLARRSEHPVRGSDRPHRRAARGRADRAPDRGDRGASATGWRKSTARSCPSRSRQPFNDLLGLSRTVFPYVEEHKFFCDYWFLTRWWNKVREFGALLAEHDFLEDGEDVFQLSRHEVASALDELALTWATGGMPLGPAALAADRRPAQADPRAARRVDATAGARRHTRGGHRSNDDHAVGRHHRSGARVGPPAGRGKRAQRRGGIARHDRGHRARRALAGRARRRTRRGDPRLRQHLAGLGADLHRRSGRP